MPSTLREAVRERLTLRAVVYFLVAMGILRVAVDASVPQLAVTAALSLVTGAADVVRDVYDVRQSVTGAWAGVVAVLGSGALLGLGEGPVWFSVTFLLVGAWFLLDAVQVARHEGLTEDEPTGREVYHNYVGRRIHETLDEQPHTRRELFDALEADDETVEAALERLRERGVVIQEGSEFRLDDSDDDSGVLAGVRSAVVGLARRIARPVALELKSGDDADGGSTPAGSDASSRSASSDGPRRRTGRERERERETESTGGR
jgi:biotin operon repressor